MTFNENLCLKYIHLLPLKRSIGARGRRRGRGTMMLVNIGKEEEQWFKQKSNRNCELKKEKKNVNANVNRKQNQRNNAWTELAWMKQCEQNDMKGELVWGKRNRTINDVNKTCKKDN